MLRSTAEEGFSSIGAALKEDSMSHHSVCGPGAEHQLLVWIGAFQFNRELPGGQSQLLPEIVHLLSFSSNSINCNPFVFKLAGVDLFFLGRYMEIWKKLHNASLGSMPSDTFRKHEKTGCFF